MLALYALLEDEDNLYQTPQQPATVHGHREPRTTLPRLLGWLAARTARLALRRVAPRSTMRAWQRSTASSR